MKRRDIHRYVVAYDISDTRRREKVATALQHFGYRIQYSVFVVDCLPAKVRHLHSKLRSLSQAEDSIVICDLGVAAFAEEKAMIWVGTPQFETPQQTVVV